MSPRTGAQSGCLGARARSPARSFDAGKWGGHHLVFSAKLNHHDLYPSDVIRLLWKSTRQSVGGLQFDLTTVPVITPLVIFGVALRLANTRL